MVHLLLSIIYLAFISLGLPDGLLGAGWPAMQTDLGAPLSYAGIVSTIIAIGTIVASLESDRMTHALGAGKVTAISVAMTCAALFGFAASNSFIGLCLWSIPYGLGAGGVDAALNNYVAVHYTSRHMSWLHCMWGLGAAIGPYIMGLALEGPGWRSGYMTVGIIQVILTAVLFLSLPLWKTRKNADDPASTPRKALKLGDVVRMPGAWQIMVSFFSYCAIEQTAMLWASSYLVHGRGMNEETAAFFGSLFLIGITIGRFASGFATMKLSDTRMIQLGMVIMAAGTIVLFFSFTSVIALIGLLLIGLGCAPVYPCIIHSTPAYFGEENSQAIVGVEMASAYTGLLVMPPLFGILAQVVSVDLLPTFLALLLAAMALTFVSLLRSVGAGTRHVS